MHCASLLVCLAVSSSLSTAAGSTSCPAAVGDGSTDDTNALQACLEDKADADEAVRLQRGATYLISQSLRPTKRRILGGANKQGTLTTIRCKGNLPRLAGGLEVRKAFEMYNIHVYNCAVGLSVAAANLTLVDSTISHARRRGLSLVSGRILMRRSRILNSFGVGAFISARSRMVMDHSEIARSKFHGVKLWGFRPQVELHFSVIRNSEKSAVEVASGSLHSSLLLAAESSLVRSDGPCVAVRNSHRFTVNFTGGSWAEGCSIGILLEDGKWHRVVLSGRSSMHSNHAGIVLRAGVVARGCYHVNITLNGGSSIRSCRTTAIEASGGRFLRLEVSGQSSIEDCGSGISVDGGFGHEVNISGGSWLRRIGSAGVTLAAEGSVLSIAGAVLRECGKSAIRVRSPSWQRRSYDDSCTNVSLRDVYIVRNQRGFQCRQTCALGEIAGVLFLNSVDFNSSCSGELSRRDPLSGVASIRQSQATVLWCTLYVAACVSSLPWLLPVCQSSKKPRFLRLVVFGGITSPLLIFRVWAKGVLDLRKLLRHLHAEDLENAGFLFALAAVMPPFSLLASFMVNRWWLKWRQPNQVSKLLSALEAPLWQADLQGVQLVTAKLQEHGLPPEQIRDKVEELRRQQSFEAGVSVAYLLSSDFLKLVRERTGLQNPTFLQMKDPFWSADDAIGKDVRCPRDGQLGCALVDTLQPRHRQRCTHFLSWVWRYPVLLVREALQIWTEEEGLDPSRTFLFMCFFVNNQFRILIEGSKAGSDDLETTFERNLQRIGRMVALLDHWKEPLYLSRVWTIFEQYMAAKLQLPVTVILDQTAGQSLVAELDRGKTGIFRITRALCNVSAETAEASVKADEDHVKALIRETTGFDYVNHRVRQSMTNWVASMLRRHMDHLVEIAKEDGPTVQHRRAALARRISCLQLQGTVEPLEVEAFG